MSDIYAASELRKQYTRFRILVIGRANAGKTTILKRVCNTTEDPRFYDEENQALLEPTATRGIHDINRPFVFESNPEFIFHDSPGFEAGDKRQLEEVQTFIEKRARAKKPDDQLHAIWFCFIPDISRFLLDLEKRFFNEKRAGNAPVIAIFTKFDDLINQVYDDRLDENGNREVARDKLNRLKAPLFTDYQFPPKTGVCLEDMHDDEGEHQKYVKKLIKETADSLDNLALKLLFVSVQKNNLELCIEYAVLYGDIFSTSIKGLVESTLGWFGHIFNKQTNYDGKIIGLFERERDQELLEELQELLLELREQGDKLDDKLLQQLLFREDEEDLLGEKEEEEEEERKLDEKLLDLLKKNDKNINIFVTELLKKEFNEPSLFMLAALLICSAQSFWYQSESRSFCDAFQLAFTTYLKSGGHSTISNDILALEMTSNSESFRLNYANLIIKHQIALHYI